HTSATGNIGLFRITSESAISAGVRRIEATSGVAAENIVYAEEDVLGDIKEQLGNPQIMQALKKMVESNGTLSKEVEALRKEQVEERANVLLSETEEYNGYTIISVINSRVADFHKELAHNLRAKRRNLVFVAGSDAVNKPSLTIAFGDDVVAKGLNAGQIVREAAKLIQGGGGGQAAFATAGGKNIDGLQAAVDAAREAIAEKLKE
ncbi:MAG: DHHA1 domain-containing protein, partial [Rikenellaceae bacterium]